MQVPKLTVLIVVLASVVGARYLAMGTGGTALYICAGMRAAVTLGTITLRRDPPPGRSG